MDKDNPQGKTTDLLGSPQELFVILAEHTRKLIRRTYLIMNFTYFGLKLGLTILKWGLGRILRTQILPLSRKDKEIVFNRLLAKTPG